VVILSHIAQGNILCIRAYIFIVIYILYSYVGILQKNEIYNDLLILSIKVFENEATVNYNTINLYSSILKNSLIQDKINKLFDKV